MAFQLDVRVTSRASRDRVEMIDGAVRVWTTAAPTEGQANEAVRRLLAKRLGVAPSRVTLRRGETGRNKTFAIEGLSEEEARRRIAESGSA